MLKGFKEFITRGNVIDLAVAVVIGAAFTALVKSVTDGIVQPIIASFGSHQANLGGLNHRIHQSNPATLININGVLTAAINFVIIAAVVYFLIVMPMTRLLALRKKGEEPESAAPAEDVLLLQEIRDLLRERPLQPAGAQPGAAAQYPNGQYPNAQLPNSQYPTQQYPSPQPPNPQRPNQQYPGEQYPGQHYPRA